MSDWPTEPVRNLVERRTERVPVEKGQLCDTMGVRWYGAGAYLRPPSRPQTKTLAKARGGDFAFCRIDTQNGPFCLVPPELDGALVTNEFPLYSVATDRIDARFLLLCFLRQTTLDRIDKMRQGRDGRARWKESDFEAWTVPVPPLDVQRRIVEVVTAVENTIKALSFEVSAASVAREALLDRLIGDLGGEVIHTSLGRVASWSSGGTPKADNPAFYGGDIAWAIIADVRGQYVSETTRTISELGLDSIGGARKVVPAGAVLVTMYGTIGRCAIATAPMATNQAICRGVPNGSVSSEYLRLWISAKRRDLIALGDGKTQQNISKAKVEAFPISVPKENDQDRIVKIMATVDDQVEALEAEIAKAHVVHSAVLESLLAHETELLTPVRN